MMRSSVIDLHGGSSTGAASSASSASAPEAGAAGEDPLRQPLLLTPTDDVEQQQQQRQQQQQLVHRRRNTQQQHHTSHHHRRSRILDRDAPFYQSRGRWQIEHVAREEARRMVTRTPTFSMHNNSSSGHNNSNNESDDDDIEEQQSATRRRSLWCCYTSRQQRQRRRRRTRRRRTVPLTKQLWDDWFHYLAYRRTIVLMMILFFVYALIVFLFGFVYLAVSKLGQSTTIDPNDPDSSPTFKPFCDMDIHNHMEALYFSLSTMTTIGYGVSDYYFGGCWTPLLLVLAQVCTAITFDAVAIGLLFQRISRGHKRTKSILFSNVACLQLVRGVPYLMFRVGELRKHQLLNISVRAYCIKHERYLRIMSSGDDDGADAAGRQSSTDAATAATTNNTNNATAATATQANANSATNTNNTIETVHYVTRPMKLVECDNLLMCLPQVIVHRIDDHSPLSCPTSSPPAVEEDGWYDVNGILHRQHQQQQHRQNDEGSQQQSQSQQALLDDLYEYVHDREIEIVLLLEGTDELTGTISQTRHSYTVNDLRFNETFVSCVYPSTNNATTIDTTEDNTRRGFWWRRCCLPRQQRRTGSSSSSSSTRRRRRQQQHQPVCVVDFGKFHDTEPVSTTANNYCPYIYD